MDDKQGGGFPLIDSWQQAVVSDAAGGAAYGPMIDALRDFLDKVAAARPDEATIDELADDLRRWSARLVPLAVAERDQIFSHRRDLPGRGQTMAPALFVEGGSADEVYGTVNFGRFYLGGNGAVHGGAIPLLFDEILGRLANAGGRIPSRTAFLHVDFRSITPIERQLQFRGWFVREEGRKRVLRAELRNGETLCAEAEGLFVALNPGQP